MNCDGCHGIGATGWVGPSLVDGRWRYGGSDRPRLSFDLLTAGARMPRTGTLSDQAIWKIVTYLRARRRARTCRPESWVRTAPQLFSFPAHRLTLAGIDACRPQVGSHPDCRSDLKQAPFVPVACQPCASAATHDDAVPRARITASPCRVWPRSAKVLWSTKYASSAVTRLRRSLLTAACRLWPSCAPAGETWGSSRRRGRKRRAHHAGAPVDEPRVAAHGRREARHLHESSRCPSGPSPHR